jgi:hypothetical protein
MAGDNTRYNVPFRAPALPYPPKMYDAKSFEDFNKILRIYFTQLDNALRDNTDANRAEAMGWYMS